MIGLILASHGAMAGGMYEAASMILGEQPAVAVLSVDRGMNPAEVRAAYRAALDALLCECGAVMIMTDMFGGTPANIGAEFIEADRIELLAGVNLPMVLKFFAARQGLALADLTQMLKQYGSQGIIVVGDLLSKPATT